MNSWIPAARAAASHLRVARLRAAQADVVADGGVEEEALLEHGARPGRPAKRAWPGRRRGRRSGRCRGVGSWKRSSRASSVLLPEPLWPDDGDRPPGGQREVDVRQHRPAVRRTRSPPSRIGSLPVSGGKLARARPLRDLRLLVEQLLHAPQSGRRALERLHDARELLDGRDHEPQQLEHGDDRPHGERPVQGQVGGGAHGEGEERVAAGRHRGREQPAPQSGARRRRRADARGPPQSGTASASEGRTRAPRAGRRCSRASTPARATRRPAARRWPRPPSGPAGAE